MQRWSGAARDGKSRLCFSKQHCHTRNITRKCCKLFVLRINIAVQEASRHDLKGAIIVAGQGMQSSVKSALLRWRAIIDMDGLKKSYVAFMCVVWVDVMRRPMTVEAWTHLKPLS